MTETAPVPPVQRIGDKPGTGTVYVILKAQTAEGAGTVWHTHDETEAVSAHAAIKAAATTKGSYVAIPARSWKPVTVSVEQTTVVTLK